jgi:anti-anti-sigma factor
MLHSTNDVGPEPDGADPHLHERLPLTGEFAFLVVHESDRGTVAWVRGDLDVQNAPALLRHLIDALDLPLETLVVDFAEVRDIDSHGIATLQAARKRAAMRGVRLIFDSIADDSVRLTLAASPLRADTTADR